MKKRLTQPKNNKYYIRTVTGGLNGAVQGYPTIAGANVLCNCVGYANGRFNEIINDPNLKGVYLPFKYQLVCNAENFIEAAKKQGLKVSSVPKKGGIMVWQKGKTLGGGDGAGHVAIVEEVIDDDTIMTSESGYNAFAFKTLKRTNKNGRWGMAEAYKFRGCIVNPSIKEKAYKPTKPYTGKLPKAKVKRGDKGDDVKACQRFLNWCMNSKLKVDGIYGDKTVAACKKFEKQYGLKVNGIFGKPNIKKAKEIVAKHKKKTLSDKIIEACKAQAEWMKNYVYGWQSKPTIPKSKKKGTCVTYVACVLQRLKYLEPGECIWHTANGKVYGTNDRMTVTYPKGKTLKQLKSQLKAGDVIIAGDAKSVEAGGNSHIFILSGKWTSGGNAYIWDNRSCDRVKRGKSGLHTYSGAKKVIAVIRLKEDK